MAPPMTRAMLRTRPPGITSPRVRGLTLVTLDMGLSSKPGGRTGVDAPLRPHRDATTLVSGLLWPPTGSCGECVRDRGAVRRARGHRRTLPISCALMMTAALTGCGGVHGAAPPVAVTPSGSTTTSNRASSKPPPGSTGVTEPKESFTADQACAQLVRTMSMSERVGQLLMVAVSSSGIGGSDAAIIERTRAGSVLLLGNSTAGMQAIQGVVTEVRDASRSPEGVKVMLAADQEGGLVQRLKGPGFARIPAAAVQAKQTDARLRRNAAEWGRQLKEAGIDANLAPVADVVPTSMIWMNKPIGQLRRGYGRSPNTVAAKVSAFTEGM